MPENKVFGQAVGGRKQKTTACSEDISLEKNDILQQYNGAFIIYNDSWQYHLIIIDSIAEIVSE